MRGNFWLKNGGRISSVPFYCKRIHLPAHTPLSPQIPHEIPAPTHCQPQPLLTRKRQQKAPLAGGRKAAETGALELGSTYRKRPAKFRPGRQRRLQDAVQQFQSLSNYLPSIGRSRSELPCIIERAPKAAAIFPSCFLLQIQHIGIRLHHRRKRRSFSAHSSAYPQQTNHHSLDHQAQTFGFSPTG